MTEQITEEKFFSSQSRVCKNCPSKGRFESPCAKGISAMQIIELADEITLCDLSPNAQSSIHNSGTLQPKQT